MASCSGNGSVALDEDSKHTRLGDDGDRILFQEVVPVFECNWACNTTFVR